MLKKFSYKIIGLLITIAIIFAVITQINKSNAEMEKYKNVDFKAVQVIVDILNVRVGPGTNYSIINRVFQNDILRVYAEINGWYLVQTIDNYFGLIKSDFVKRYNGNITSSNNVNSKTNSSLFKMEQELNTLINQERKKAGVKALKLDENISKIARTRAKDMVSNNYFSHTSSKYGSVFDMLKNNKIKYKIVGENIAGSADIKQTLKAWLKTDSHKKNILNKNYNYTGIGIAKSKDYGLIIVQDFIGR
ncbi:MAG: CAP domain-containing protein [Ignavibacteriales bacterium]